MFAEKKMKTQKRGTVHTEKKIIITGPITNTPLHKYTLSFVERSTISARPRLLFDGEILGGKLFEII